LRDLVRRSLLARICLASGETSLWPLDTDTGVDAAMADDAVRSEWQRAWRGALATIDSLAAANRPLRHSMRMGVLYDNGYEEWEEGELSDHEREQSIRALD